MIGTAQNFGQQTAAQILANITASTQRHRCCPKNCFRDRYGRTGFYDRKKKSSLRRLGSFFNRCLMQIDFAKPYDCDDHNDPPQSENHSETRMNQSETSQKSVRNQDEINTNAAAGAAASAAATVVTTAKAALKTRAAA